MHLSFPQMHFTRAAGMHELVGVFLSQRDDNQKCKLNVQKNEMEILMQF